MTNLDNDVIGKLIEQLLVENEMSEPELAEALNVNKVSVFNWVKGIKRPSLTNIAKIAELFRVTVDEIVSGKLNREGNIDYLKRNFDLSVFDLDEMLKNKNITGVNEYLKRCLSIKSRYTYLIKNWCFDEISDAEKEELDYLKEYMSIDIEIFGDKYVFDYKNIIEHKEDINLKGCLKDYYNNIASLFEEDEEAYNWEVEKLIKTNINLDTNGIIHLNNDYTFCMLCYLLTQQHRDELLEYNLKGKTREDLSGNEYFGVMLDTGANYLYRFRRSSALTDDEIFNLFEGKIEEDVERTLAGVSNETPGYNLAGQPQLYLYSNEWKNMSFSEYKKTINTKRTKYLADLCMIKYFNPLMYLNNLEEGKYDNYF